MMSKLKSLFKYLFLFLAGGVSYYGIEIAWRGHSHWSMMVLGGLCFVLVGLINNFFTFDMYMEVQALIGSIIITVLEFCTGMVVNVLLGWNVWDYSNKPLNIYGQVCIEFTAVWFFLSILIIYVDDYIRYMCFNERYPNNKFWFFQRFFK